MNSKEWNCCTAVTRYNTKFKIRSKEPLILVFLLSASHILVVHVGFLKTLLALLI